MTTAAASTDEYENGTVYLIHFDQPYKHAKHYTGFAPGSLAQRLAKQAAGQGARLMQVIKEAGITWQLARTWPGTRMTERQIKNMKCAPKLCPVCTPHPQPGTGHRPKPGTGHRPKPADQTAHREAAAFLAGVRAADTWAAPLIAAGRLAGARQMLALDYQSTDREDAERQRGFTGQLAAMLRTADTRPDQAREPQMKAGQRPAGKEAQLRDHQATAAALRAKAGAAGVTPTEAAALRAKADDLVKAHPAPEPVRPAVAPLTGMTLSEALGGRRSASPPPPARQAKPGGCDHEAGQ